MLLCAIIASKIELFFVCRALGGNRSKAAVEKRVRALNLHLEGASEDDEPEMESGQSESEAESSVASSNVSSAVGSGLEDDRGAEKTRVRSEKKAKKQKKKIEHKDKLNTKRPNLFQASGPGSGVREAETIPRVVASPLSSSNVKGKDIWLEDDEDGEDKWTGYRAFKSQAKAALSSTANAAVPSLLKKRKATDDDDNWEEDNLAIPVIVSTTISGLASRRKILKADDSDDE